MLVTVDGDESGTTVTVRHHDATGSTSPLRLPLPHNQLDRTGLEALLNAGKVAGASEAARRYGNYLRALLRPAWPDRQDQPVVIAVSGSGAAHRPLWEALHLRGDCLVVHLVAPVERLPQRRGEPVGAELAWVGARPHGDRDLPRYLVLGDVLAEALRPGSAVVPRILRTDAHRDELDVRRWPAPRGTARVVQLDAHGMASVNVVDDDVGAVFSFQVRGKGGPDSVPDVELLDLLRAMECTVFLTNSCSAAQQRGVKELPFPARVVQVGARVALGVREPLTAAAAGVLFPPIYAALSTGAPILEAVRAGLAALHAGEGSLDERVYRLLQPVLWLHDVDDVLLSFASSGPLGDRVELAGLAGRNGVIARLFCAVEDTVWNRQTCDQVLVRALPSCGLSDATLGGLGDLLSRCFGLTAEGYAVFAIPRLSLEERTALVEYWFNGSPALIKLLAEVLAEDPAYLGRLSYERNRDAVQALLSAMSWGGAADPTLAIRATAAAAQVERHKTQEADSSERGAKFKVGLENLALALPAFGVGERLLVGRLPMPALGASPQIAEQTMEGELASVVKVADTFMFLPFPAVQHTVRAKIDAKIAHGLSLMVLYKDFPREGVPDLPWNHLAHVSTLANLALAVAARQVGSCDPVALSSAAWGLSRFDYAAAIELVRALTDGLPGWPSVHELATDAYTDLLASLAAVDRQEQEEIHEDHDNWRGWVNSALTALHGGNPERVLRLVARARERLGDNTPVDLRKAEAYALARTGRPGEALTIAVGIAQQLPELSRFDQAEVLHLLGELAEGRGRVELAIRYLLDERAVNPPAQSARLHNRHHLMDLLRATGSAAHNDMAVTVAREGLALAREMGADTLLFADALLDMAVSDTTETDLGEVIALVGTDGTPRLKALAEGAHAIGREASDDAIALLTPLLSEGDSITGHAAYLLGAGVLTGGERLRVLRLGSETSTKNRYRLMCVSILLASCWEESEHDQLQVLALSYVDNASAGLAARARAALGALAITRGELDDGVRWYAEAIALAGLTTLHSPFGDVLLSDHSGLTDQVSNLVTELLQERIEAEVDGQAPQGLLADVGLIEAIDRLAGMYSSDRSTVEHIERMAAATEPSPDGQAAMTVERMRAEHQRRSSQIDNDELVADLALYLCGLSEGFWTLQKLDAALAARGQACRLYEEIGDHARLAFELGWMGAIARQAGRPGEAEALYQKAIAIGNSALPAAELAFIVGRYGNLLHERKDFAAAVHQQWRGVCLIRGVEAPLAPESLAELGTWTEVDPDHADRWALLLANLTNCLAATKHALFPAAVELAVQAHQTAQRLQTQPDSGAEFNLSTTARLLRRLIGLRRSWPAIKETT